MSHAHLSIFANLVGGSARLSHLPIDMVIFAWHVVSIFLLLLAAWQLLGSALKAATHGGAAWRFWRRLSVCRLPAPALAIMDPYLTARSLSTPATLFAVACYLSNKPRRALAWLVLTAAVHPQMAVYGLLFIGCMELVRRRRTIARGCRAGVRCDDRSAVPLELRTGDRACARMPVVADLLFRFDVDLVPMDRRVRAAGLAVVVLRGKSPAHAARVSRTGEQPDSVRPVVHRDRRDPGDPGDWRATTACSR